MRRILATFSGRAYDATTSLTVERAPQMGADEAWVFDDSWLMQSGFYERNRWLFEAGSQIQNTGPVYKHGFGWCSWKAHIILTAFERLQPGDIVLYLDGDTYPVAPFGQLFEACDREGGVFLFMEQGCNNLRFCKADCFRAMGVPIEEGQHACGRFSLWQKGSFLAQQMLAEWWAYSINPRCTLWDTSVLGPDQPEYYRNSTEQSVLSLLAGKYKLPLHRTPDQFGSLDMDYDLYPQIFEQRHCGGNRDDLSGSSYRNV